MRRRRYVGGQRVLAWDGLRWRHGVVLRGRLESTGWRRGTGARTFEVRLEDDSIVHAGGRDLRPAAVVQDAPLPNRAPQGGALGNEASPE